MTQKRYNEIPKRQKCVNKEEPYIGGAVDIVDDTLGKPQSEVNQDRIEDIAAEVQRAQGAESTLDGKIGAEKTRAEGVEGGLNTRLQTVEQLAEISIGGGDAQIATGADFTNPDATKRAKIPTVGAIVDGLNDGIYDVSKRNPTAGPNSDGKFTLDYILSNADTLIPTGWRHGGMTISFVDSSDNKYVQCRLMAQNFTTDVTKWQGVDTELSENSHNLIENKPVAASLQKIKNTYSDKEDDVLYIADLLGHVVARIDKDGIKAINLIKDNIPVEGSDNYVKSGGVYDAIMNAINVAIHNTSELSSEDNTFHVVDANGYIVMEIDKDGLKVINQFDNSILYKKKIIGVGDSLSVDGKYEKELCRLGNATYGGVFSAGGTNTLPNNLNSSQDRIKELIEGDVDFDILVFENINDRWRAFTIQDGHHVKKGNISDNSFMLSQYIDDTNVYATLQEAQIGFISDFSTIVAGVSDKKAGSVIQVEYQTETIILSVNSAATSNGDIQVIVGENICNVSVTAGMTANTIAYLISQYNFEGYEVQRSNNTVTLYLKSGYTISTPTFNMGSTGVTMSYTNGTSSGYYRRFFTGYSSSEFVDIANWSDDLSLYSLYKGIIEYIQNNRPQAKIVFFAPSIWGELPQTNIPSSLTNSDGSYNITKILNSDYKTYIFTDNKYLREIQKECASLYGCKFIDAMVEGGISPFNISEYYNSTNVHPKDIKAYNIWGSLLFNKLH